MARTTTSHRCTECGWTSARWVGRCGQCQAWGSIVEAAPAPSGTVKSQAPAAAARPISQVASTEARAVPTGIGELDRVLGTGLVPGGVVLVGGEPGVGKSTLLLSVAARWAARGGRTLYISGEESAAQVRLRAERISAVHDELYLASENDLGTVLGHIEQLSPACWCSTRFRPFRLRESTAPQAASPRCVKSPPRWCGSPSNATWQC